MTVDRPLAPGATGTQGPEGTPELRPRPSFAAQLAPRLSLEGPSLRRLVIALGTAEVLLLATGPLLLLLSDPDRQHFGDGFAIGLGGLAVVVLVLQYFAIRSVLGRQIHDQRALREFSALLDDTIANERLRVVFQPVFRASDGVQVGVEALTRFQVENGMCPEAWFAAAQSVGRTQRLEMLAIRMAFRYTSDLPDSLYLAVNVSPETFVSAELRALILGSSLANDRIVLELTEHVAISDYGPVIASRQLYREANVRVAIDDTGAGFSSFRHVIAISPDIIKMDHSLAAGVDRDPLQSGLVAAVLTFARAAGIVVVAEGVETTGQLMQLTRLGVDQIQGHLLGAPAAPPPLRNSR